MAKRPSLFERFGQTVARLTAQVFDFVIGRGKPEKIAIRRAKKIEAAPASAFRRLHPKELKKLEYSAKSKRYALKGAAINKNTITISERQWRNKEAAQYNETPETLPAARRRGEVGYRTAAQKEATAKAVKTRFRNSVRRRVQGGVGDNIEGYGGKHSYRITRPMADHFEEWRNRKLAGEWLDDGTWHAMIDIARRYNDPEIGMLRASPPAYGVTVEKVA